MTRIKNIIYFTLVTIFTLALIFLIIFLLPAHPTGFDPDLIIKEVKINYQEDRNKPGIMHSRLFTASFKMAPKVKGSSPDVVHIKFDRPAEILGFWISIDHPDMSLNLVEFTAVVNAKKGYHTGTKNDAIIHTSYVLSTFRKTDEKILFQPNYGINITEKDFVALGAYITNLHPFSEKGVSGEFIIYYRWIDQEKNKKPKS